MHKYKNSAFIKLAVLITAILLLVAIPQSPFLIIKGIKKKAGQVELELPVKILSENLAVGSCSEEKLSTLYDSASNFNVAKSGLNVFKSRLAKEYKNSSNNFNSLAIKVLATSQSADSQNNTCLLPLKISVDSKLGVDISNANLLNVSLGAQSIFCSNGKAYLSDDSEFFPLDKSIADFAGQIKQKQAVITLTKQLAALQKKKSALSASKKSERAKLDTEIRRKSFAVSYAQYFAKDATLLATFLNAICQQAAIIATPNSLPPTAIALATATPVVPNRTPVSTATSVVVVSTATSAVTNTPNRTFTATSTATVTPTISVTTAYKVNDRIRLKTAETRIRTEPRIAEETLKGVQLTGATGTIIAGPVATDDSYGTNTWWNVNFDNGLDGWCAENNYELIPPCVEGTTESRTRYLTADDSNGQVCKGEEQARRCTNGVFGNWSGSYTYESCYPKGDDLLNMAINGDNRVYQPKVGSPITFGKVTTGAKRTQFVLNGASESEANNSATATRANELIFNSIIDGYNFNSSCPKLSDCKGAQVNPEALLMLWGWNSVIKNVLIKNVEIRNAAYFVNDGAHVDTFQVFTAISPDNWSPADGKFTYNNGAYMLDAQEWFVFQDSIIKNSDHNLVISEANYFKGVVYQNIRLTAQEPTFHADCVARLAAMGADTSACGAGNSNMSAGYPWNPWGYPNRPARTTWMINVVPSSGGNAVEVDSANGAPQSASNVWGPIILVGPQTKSFNVFTNYYKTRSVVVNGKTVTEPYWEKHLRDAGTNNAAQSAANKVYRYNTIEEAVQAGHAQPPMVDLSCSGWATAPAKCTNGIGALTIN